MKLIAEVTGYSLVEGQEYELIYEYDTVYEVRFANGTTGCRQKGFFKVAPDTLEEMKDNETICNYCKCTDYGDSPEAAHISAHSSGCEGSYCDEAYELYLNNLGDDK